MTRDIHHIQEAASQAMRDLLAEAYELGREVGRQEATNLLMTRFQEFVLQPLPSPTSAAARPVDPAYVEPEEPEERAAPGTVKPVIHQLVVSSKTGITMADIERQTGFKSNTVRGTLYALKREGFVDKEGDHWYPLTKEKGFAEALEEKAASFDPSKSQLAALFNNPADDRETGPGGGT